MSFTLWRSPTTSETDLHIDIIAVNAICADPVKTWNTTRDHQPYQWVQRLAQDEIPTARVLLYDHLVPAERAIELEAVDHPEHKASATAYAAVQDRISKSGIEEWTERFVKALHGWRDTKALQRRPLLFISHSTGGIIVKQALCKKFEKGEASLAALCIGCVFFATPHHGSSVLSGPEFRISVKNKLKLKFEMSEHLCNQFALQHPDLEYLNHQFGAASLGIKIWNYIETKEMQLKVLTSDDGGESLTKISLPVLDDRSAIMTTPDFLIEEEEVKRLNTNHVGCPRFADKYDIMRDFYDELKIYIRSTSASDRAAHHQLTTSIMNHVIVDVHQFYQMDISSDSVVMKVWSEQPTLQQFLESGPSECLKARLQSSTENNNHVNGNANPFIKVRHDSSASAPVPSTLPSSEINMPSITIVPVHGEGLDATSGTKRSILEAPTIIVPKNIHTRRPPITITSSDPESANHLAPTVIPLQTSSAALERDPDHVHEPRPQRAHTYQQPSQSTDRFRWVHIPYTHHGWVAQILNTISQEKGNHELHKKLLSDQIWSSHHNRSRHASFHARFVRPACKTLLPKNSSLHNDELLTTSSSIDDVQLALYLPYLHWDTFQRLQDRAAVIQKRGNKLHARPVDRDVAKGSSVECKLIWQYLNSTWPIHIRRTLDQYGYPSLRNTTVRDADQILYKQTRNPMIPDLTANRSSMHNISAILHSARAQGPRHSKVKTMSDGAAKVLMVDQLWLFVVDNETVVTFAAPKEKDPNDNDLPQADIKTNIYKDVNGDYASQCEDCFDFAALAVYHAVTALLDNTEDTNLQVFRIFEEYISELTEQQTRSFKEFRDNHRYRDPSDLDVSRLPHYVDNREDLNALLELRDIEDELTTIQKLFIEQHKTIKDMLKQYAEIAMHYQMRKLYEKIPKHHQHGRHGHLILQAVDHTIEGYEESVKGMLKSADVAQKAFEKLLDMKQKQANIVEAHLAREQTEVAADQSRSVMIFTIFTIIFLPLSFFASVFGMNISEWSGVDSNIDFYHAFVYMGCISLAVIVVALLVAFNRFSRRALRRIWKVLAKPVTNALNRIPSQRVHDIVHYMDVERGQRGLIQESVVQARERSRSRPGRPQSRPIELHYFDKSNLAAFRN